ncbi:MAG: molybdopterin molybdotransferase MoeA [Deltaproteobacteria bacterium]|nr:molybdopterin molybdotransferase MoeA [Deltaproteobacteria bacterium]
MISYEEALQTILGAISPLGLEKVSLFDALDRVIGEDIFAGRAIPPKDNSAMDGYALRAEDTVGASKEKPIRLEVIEDIPAGTIPTKIVGPGQAARIMTGAPLPAGADAILRMEDTKKEGQKVAIFVPVTKGQDIRYQGEDVRQGEQVIAKGDVIRPAEVGMLASLGRSFVFVHQKPVVAVVSTGDELVDIDELSTPWKIINSNGYSLAALVKDCGAVPMQMGIARDKREDLIEKFQAALRADLILSSGGVSVGDYDLVKTIMKEVGNRMQFWRVAMRPGRPLAFGSLGNVPLVGLPGNPVASMVSFQQFVRPAILKMLGHRNLFRRTIKARLAEPVQKGKEVRQFIRALIRRTKDGYEVVTTGDQGSGILKSMVRANGLVVIPVGVEKVAAGEWVTVQLLDDSLDRMPEPGV